MGDAQRDGVRLDAIRPQTAELFSVLGRLPQLRGLTLIGGTAIALIIGHRLSNDLDFACPGDRLPTEQIDALMNELRAGGMRVQLITNPDQITRFKIATSRRLLDVVRDYVLDGTKVSFFAMGAKQTPHFTEYLSGSPVLHLPELSFSILSLGGLQVTKAVVLGQRVRSRELYDLFVLSRDYGYSAGEILDDAVRYGANNDPEYYKAVLRGEIPLDDDDEGLEPLGIAVTLDTIYRYFDEAVSRAEVAEATRIARRGA